MKLLQDKRVIVAAIILVILIGVWMLRPKKSPVPPVIKPAPKPTPTVETFPRNVGELDAFIRQRVKPESLK